MNYSAFQIMYRVIKLAKPYWFQLVGIFVLNLVATPIALLKPIALKILIDSGFGDSPLPSFIAFFFPDGFEFNFNNVVLISASLVIIVALINNIHSLMIWISSTYTGEKLVLSFRTMLFNHLQRLSLAYHDNTGAADSLYRIQYDTMAIRKFLIDNFSSLLSSFITLLAMTIVMFKINWHFAAVALCVMPPLGILIRMSAKRLRKGWMQVKDSESRAMSVIHEALNSLRVVKAFGREAREEKRFADQADEALKGEVKMALTGSVFDLFVGFVFATGGALFIYFGAGLVRSGEMTLGELVLVIAYLAQIFDPLERISKNINAIQSSLISLDRVFTVFDKEHDVTEAENPVPLNTLKGHFQFNSVYFAYNEKQNIIKDVSFEIRPGDRVGIMGSTGAGKSTLINLLTRFYDPEKGSILADGVNIREYKLADYRNQFGIVLQDAILFSTTIEENIAYGKQGASKKEIIEAAISANAHDFILRSKDGYNTQVGQRGMQLSGGERQRISLARAFIKNAPVLIMDEPTSSVDIKTESLIMEAMERLMKGKTTFLITHRLDTLKSCNIILHLEKGNLIDIVSNKNPELFETKKQQLIEMFFNGK